MNNYNNNAFIFDLDGTLVDLRQIWEQAYAYLYQKKYGFTLTEAEMKSMFGPPELECHTNILQGRGLYTVERAQELVRSTESTMLLTLARTDLPRHIIPGAIPCLLELQRSHAALAVATGNIESIARGIVGHSGLREYFPVISFSSPQTAERYQIVAEAKLELEQLHQTSFEPWKTYVVGDSPSDIQAAQRLGLISVGVATGHYNRQELAQEKPDLLLENLTELAGKI